MTVNNVMSFFTQGGGGALAENELLGTVPAGSVLTKIDVTGQMTTLSVAAAVAAGSFEPLNLMTGLQYVAHGGTPVTVTSVPVSSGNWLKFSDGFAIPPTPQFWVQSTTYVQYVVFGFKERWRGQHNVSADIDVYWSYGENTALSDTVGYRAFASYNLEWASFP